MTALDTKRLFDAVDESARRQHAHIQAIAADHLSNLDRAIQQTAAIGVINGAQLAQLQDIAGPGMSAVNAKVIDRGQTSQDTTNSGPEQTDGGADTGTTEGISGSKEPEAQCAFKNLRRIRRLLGSAAVLGGIIAAIAIAIVLWQFWPESAPPPPPTDATQAGSLYQYLEDQDAHLPQ